MIRLLPTDGEPRDFSTELPGPPTSEWLCRALDVPLVQLHRAIILHPNVAGLARSEDDRAQLYYHHDGRTLGLPRNDAATRLYARATIFRGETFPPDAYIAGPALLLTGEHKLS